MKISRAAIVGSLVLASACGGGGQDLTTPTTTTSAPTITETFTGTLPPLGLLTHTFNSGVGTISIRLAAAGPPDTIQIGLGAGVPLAAGGCSVDYGVTTAAGATPQIPGTVRTAGPLCVTVADVGNLSAEITYTIEAIHP